VDDKYRYIRGCGYVGDDGVQLKPNAEISGECVKRAGTFSVLVQYCSCNGIDGCNHAGHLIASYISALIPLVLIMAKMV